MPNVLRNEAPPKSIATDLGWAAVAGFVLVLPFAVLEALNNTITGQNAPGLILLFGLMWLLPVTFVVVLAPLVRTVRAGRSVTANPLNLLLRVSLLALIAMAWGGILNDQLPCFLGVPNCD